MYILFVIGLLNASNTNSSTTSDSATLTALPSGIGQNIVQPSIQSIAMTPVQSVAAQPSTHHPMVYKLYTF